MMGKPNIIPWLVNMLGEVPQSTLYRNMIVLLEEPLVEVVHTNKVQGREKHFFI
ncbi:hypothetical protein J18TS1_44630 [Oceanobacillus oncorhynchi subsp. incaldanensis]|nr:hypothetical protein J18TS1_44630 [Oceanobacillus oncorhynchi subsp. incaldanensis]